jgi:uncharacterized protein YcnI
MSKSRIPLVLRAGAALVAAAALTIGGAAIAEAHVHVTPDTTAAGGYSVLTFRVPTESDTAGTVGLEVDLPTDTPFTFVAVEPIPGWKAVVTQGDLPKPVEVDGTTITKAATKVTWTAEGSTQVAPGQFQQFLLQAGPLPKEGTTVTLPAKQTYSDGKVVNWNEPTVAGQAEPEDPAPAFEVTAAAAGDDDTAAPVATAVFNSSNSDSTARWLGGGGLAVGVIGLLLAAVAWRRLVTLTKSSAAGTPSNNGTNSDTPSNSTSQGSAV